MRKLIYLSIMLFVLTFVFSGCSSSEDTYATKDCLSYVDGQIARVSSSLDNAGFVLMFTNGTRMTLAGYFGLKPDPKQMMRIAYKPWLRDDLSRGGVYVGAWSIPADSTYMYPLEGRCLPPVLQALMDSAEASIARSDSALSVVRKFLDDFSIGLPDTLSAEAQMDSIRARAARARAALNSRK